jgi:hypothetical protein
VGATHAADDPADSSPASESGGQELRNEFASVRVSVDHRGNGPRLLVEDLETGAHILLSPIELASLCLATDDDRTGWLRVGPYRRGGT